MLDAKELENKLAGMTGHDFEELERDERDAGNRMADVINSRSFMARIAARALQCNPGDVKDLPLKQYVELTTRVNNFLLSDLTEAILASRSEKQQ